MNSVIVLQGGLKAVVWTDTIQTMVMFASLIVVIAMGVVSIGGFGEVWTRNTHGGRIDFFKYTFRSTLDYND